ncbi:MAG: hypothetical protein AB7H80_06300 [Candidatus Kapaibacterium sp.]
MHPLTAIFRQTLQELLDYYAQFKKSEYMEFLRAFIPQVLVMALVALIFVVVRDFLSRGVFIDQIVMRAEFRNMFGALLILGLGFKGGVLVRKGKEGDEELVKPSQEELLGADRTSIILLFALILLVLHALLYVNPFYHAPSNLFEAFAPKLGWEHVLYTLTELTKNQLLPLFLAVLLILYRMWGKVNLDIIREYRWAYLAAILFLFAFYTIFTSFVEICRVMLGVQESVSLRLFNPTQLLAWLLFVVSSFFLLSLFYPVFSKTLSFSFRIEDEMLAKEEIEERDELSEEDELPLTGE